MRWLILLLLSFVVLTACRSDIVGTVKAKRTSNDLMASHSETYLDCGYDFLNEEFSCQPATRMVYTYNRFGYLLDIQTEEKVVTIEVSQAVYDKYKIGDKYNSSVEKK